MPYALDAVSKPCMMCTQSDNQQTPVMLRNRTRRSTKQAIKNVLCIANAVYALYTELVKCGPSPCKPCENRFAETNAGPHMLYTLQGFLNRPSDISAQSKANGETPLGHFFTKLSQWCLTFFLLFLELLGIL